MLSGNVFTSCSFLEKEENEGVLARVYDKYLYKKDIEDLLTKLKGDKDSTSIITNYINTWIQQELLLEKAELNLSDEQKDFSKLLEDYRRSLIIYAFQKEWIREKLDTNVTGNEIEAHYQENQSNFELKENIVKMRFARVPKNAPKLHKLEKMIQADDEESKLEFRDYCLQYAIKYHDNDTMWMPFDEVKSTLPVVIDQEEDFLRTNHFVIRADSVNFNLLYILDYKIKNSISPLSFEREKIRQIIINQRKLELMNNLKNNLFEVALDKGNAEIYTP